MLIVFWERQKHICFSYKYLILGWHKLVKYFVEDNADLCSITDTTVADGWAMQLAGWIQGISSNAIDLILPEDFSFNTKRVKARAPFQIIVFLSNSNQMEISLGTHPNSDKKMTITWQDRYADLAGIKLLQNWIMSKNSSVKWIWGFKLYYRLLCSELVTTRKLINNQERDDITYRYIKSISTENV